MFIVIQLAVIFLTVVLAVLFFAFVIEGRKNAKMSPTEKKRQTSSQSEERKDGHLTGEQAEKLRNSLPTDENGRYIFDRTKPYGSVFNPVVVGMPEYSTVLIYDAKKDRWILTDGLGNGWIR